MFGIVIMYSIGGAGVVEKEGDDNERAQPETQDAAEWNDAPPSSFAPSSVTLFSPSMVVDTLFPKNFDLGLSSPMIVTPFAGDV